MVETATLGVDVWTIVFNHLQTGDYEISTDNIHSSYNDSLTSDEGFPQVIIGTPRVGRTKETLKNITGTYTYSILMTVEVYHNSNQSCKTLMDEVRNKLETGESVFNDSNLDMQDLPMPDYDWEDKAGGKTHILTFDLEFMY